MAGYLKNIPESPTEITACESRLGRQLHVTAEGVSM